jgi:hypothetical protein
MGAALERRYPTHEIHVRSLTAQPAFSTGLSYVSERNITAVDLFSEYRHVDEDGRAGNYPTAENQKCELDEPSLHGQWRQTGLKTGGTGFPSISLPLFPSYFKIWRGHDPQSPQDWRHCSWMRAKLELLSTCTAQCKWIRQGTWNSTIPMSECANWGLHSVGVYAGQYVWMSVQVGSRCVANFCCKHSFRRANFLARWCSHQC